MVSVGLLSPAIPSGPAPVPSAGEAAACGRPASLAGL